MNNINMNKTLLEISMHEVLTLDVIKLLRSRNIFSILDFIQAETSVLINLTGLNLREVLDCKKSLLWKYTAKPLCASQLNKNFIRNSALLPTGIKSLDILLQGGLFTKFIYEIYGLPASGKTYFCYTVLKNICVAGKDNIYFIDTKQNFSGIKFKKMLNLEQEKSIEVMNKIIIKSAMTAQKLLSSLLNVISDIENGINIRVVLIDSLASIFLLYDTESVSERNMVMSYIITVIRYLANEYHVAVLVTNLMTLWNEGDFRNIDSFQEKIACGRFWRGIPNVCLQIEKNSENNTQAKIILKKSIGIMPVINTCDVNFNEFGLE